jgi:small acid-soluble spore protein (thioredoxin-like protein)
MNSKPDDRSDNVKKIRKNIDCTVKNMELADDMIASTDDGNTKNDLKEKNDRRAEAVNSMRNELRDEVDFQNKKQK